jgi:outer membrane protein assembly factor BamB
MERGAYALRLDDGKEVWHRNVKQGQIPGRMVADETGVYFGAGRTVYACAARTGNLLWQTPLQGTIVTGLTGGKGRLFVPAGEHELFCLDTRRGKILWDYHVDLPILMEPAADGSSVFFGALDGYFRALDAVTGKEIWKYQWSSKEDMYTTAPYWPPVLDGDKVIVGKSPAGKEEKNLVAFHASSGKILWSRPLAGWPLRFLLDPERGKFYTTYTQNRIRGLQCLSVEDGSLLWSKATGVGMNAGCATRDMVLMRDEDKLCCVEAGTGEVQWIYHTSTSSQGSLYGAGATAVKDNMAIVGTMDGQVFALKWISNSAP